MPIPTTSPRIELRDFQGLSTHIITFLRNFLGSVMISFLMKKSVYFHYILTFRPFEIALDCLNKLCLSYFSKFGLQRHSRRFKDLYLSNHQTRGWGVFEISTISFRGTETWQHAIGDFHHLKPT